MKKSLSIILALTMVIALATTASASMKTRPTMSIMVNSKIVDFKDAKPYCDLNDRTMVPVRFIAEHLGAKVSWDDEAQSVIVENKQTKLTIPLGSDTFTKKQGDEETIVQMDTVSVMRSNRVYMPLRFVAEAMDAFVDYSSHYNTAEMTVSKDLTTEELSRLRSYHPVDWVETNDADSKGSYIISGIYNHCDDEYWFANAHQYLMGQNWEYLTSAKDIYQHKTTKEDCSAYDYVKAASEYVKAEIEAKNTPQNMKYGVMQMPGQWTNSQTTCHFRTDMSLTYHPNCKELNYIAIRGIMEVTVNDSATRLENVASQFGIENPVPGTTYPMDVEFIVSVDDYNCFDSVAEFRFEDGAAVEFGSPFGQK